MTNKKQNYKTFYVLYPAFCLIHVKKQNKKIQQNSTLNGLRIQNDNNGINQPPYFSELILKDFYFKIASFIITLPF